jgi:hypothetical protein
MSFLDGEPHFIKQLLELALDLASSWIGDYVPFPLTIGWGLDHLTANANVLLRSSAQGRYADLPRIGSSVSSLGCGDVAPTLTILRNCLIFA